MGDVEKAVENVAGDTTAGENDNDKGNTNYRRDKPWDNDGIDHWARDDFKPSEHGSGAFLEESSFATLFPQYRERYLRQVWKAVTAALDKYGIGCELNVVEGSMTVRTTRRTRDPFIIMKARDLIKLLARSVPLAQAVKILDDDMNCDIVKIGNFTDNKQRFVKRRERLIGPKGSTLKAIELLTDCYMLVQGNTVAVMGGFKGMKNARKIIEDCMQNVHPVYNIKRFMIMRELDKDPELKGTDWSRFLPQFKKTNNNAASNKQKKKNKKIREQRKQKEKDYSAFPPLPQPSKIDKQLESGEYFLSDDVRRQNKVAKQKAQREQTARLRREEKEKAYALPGPSSGGGADGEGGPSSGKKRRRHDEDEQDTDKGGDVTELAERIRKRAKKNKKKKRNEAEQASV